MPRSRFLKHDFFLDDDLAQLPFEARLLFQGLWIIADREGRLEDSPRKIKALIFPYDEVITFQRADDLLNTLANPNLSNRQNKIFIRRYVVDNIRYIDIPNFVEHQPIHHTEKPSKIPPFNGELTVKAPLKNGECQDNTDTDTDTDTDKRRPNFSTSDAPSVDKPVDNSKPKTRRALKVFPDDSLQIQLSQLMYKEIRMINPQAKEPNLQSWARDMDLLVRIDKRTQDEIERMLEKVYKHDFWHKNILSPAALRKQWDRLVMEFRINCNAKASPKSSHARTYDTADAPMILSDIMKGISGK